MGGGPFLQSARGRFFLQVTAVSASIAAFLGYFLPQTVFLEDFLTNRFVQSYTNDRRTPVTLKVQRLYEQVLNDLQISQKEQSLFNIFTTFGLNPFHAGTTSLRSGALIGVPCNFYYEAETDINHGFEDSLFQLLRKFVNWDSEAGKSLRSSLLLTDEAKKFALAREVVSTRGKAAVWLYSLYPSLFILFTYTTCKSFNEHFTLRNRRLRFLMYIVVGIFNGISYCGMTDFTTVTLEINADKKAAELGQAYTRGGIEFYTKLSERNRALRRELGTVGENLFMADGNEVRIWGDRTTPITIRRQLLLDMQQRTS